MFRDRQEELERLEKALQETQEETEAFQTEDADDTQDIPDYLREDASIGESPEVYRNFSNNYGKDLRNFASGYQAYNADRVDTDPELFSRQVLQEEKPGAIRTAVVLLALIGIVTAIIAWIYLRLGGLL